MNETRLDGAVLFAEDFRDETRGRHSVIGLLPPRIVVGSDKWRRLKVLFLGRYRGTIKDISANVIVEGVSDDFEQPGRMSQTVEEESDPDYDAILQIVGQIFDIPITDQQVTIRAEFVVDGRQFIGVQHFRPKQDGEDDMGDESD